MKNAVIAILRVSGLLPQAYKAKMLAATLAPSTVRRNVGYWLGPKTETAPVPDFWARLLVAGSADIPGFLESGRRGFECIRDTLEKNGVPLTSLSKVLDFGCGCGRVLRHWRGAPGVKLYGTDMNPYLVAACRRCAPEATIDQNTLEPRLTYGDREFDLVYAFSVFTHLDLDDQRAWLREFHRILKPGGVLLLSVHGEAYRSRLTESERKDFDAQKLVVRHAQYPGGNLCVTFHPEAYARALFAQGFEIVDMTPQGAKGNPVQDLYMLRRLD